MSSRLKVRSAAVAASLLAASAVGCSSAPDPQVVAPERPAAPAAPAAPAVEVLVEGAWARSLPNGMGAVYGVFTASADDVLVSASVSPSSVASSVEIHEVVADEDGVMRMREMVGGLQFAAGVPLEMRPGGYHIMLMGMPAMLEPGTMFEVTLTFLSGSSVAFPVAVADADAGSEGMHGEMHDGMHDGMHGDGMHDGSEEGMPGGEDAPVSIMPSSGGGADILFF